MSTVFVAMPFADNQQVFLKIFCAIEQVCDETGFKAVRVDRSIDAIVSENNDILQTIHRGIEQSTIVIGDLSPVGKNRINPNVLYEYALASGMNKHTIAISQSIDDLPFDLRTHHIIQYDSTKKGLSTLKSNLKRKIYACKAKIPKRQLAGAKVKENIKAKAIAVLNYKGGVGKTTLTLNLGASFAEAGYKTLLIDLDPHMSLTFACVEREISTVWEENKGTIGDVFNAFVKDDSVESFDEFNLNNRIMKNVLRGKIADFKNYNKTKQKITGLDLIPSDPRLSYIETFVLSESHKIVGSGVTPDMRWYWEVTILRDLLSKKFNGKSIYDDYDVILFDCPPNLYLGSQNALMASDYWISPVIADFLSITGYRLMRKRILDFKNKFNQQVNKFNQQVNLYSDDLVFESYSEIGAVFMKLEKGGARRDFFVDERDNIEHLKAEIGEENIFPVTDAQAYVPKSTRIAKVMANKTSVYKDKETEKFCINFSNIRDEIIKRIDGFPKIGMLKRRKK